MFEQAIEEGQEAQEPESMRIPSSGPAQLLPGVSYLSLLSASL